MNAEAFLHEVLSPLLTHPDDLRIEVQDEGRKREILIHAHPEDHGRIIGRSGRMISSLRTLCRTAGDKEGLRVNLELFEEGPRSQPEA